MSWQVEIARVRRELIEHVTQKTIGLFGWTLTSNASSMGDQDQVKNSDDDDSGGQRPVRRIEPWGLRGVPVAKVRSFWVRLGSSNTLFIGIAPNKGYGPTDLDNGEVCLYSDQVERGVWLTKDGDTKLAAKSGRKVQVGGDTYAMPKWDDFATALKACTAAIKALTPATDPATVILLANGIRVAVTALDTAMGLASNYKSTNATNG